MPRQMMLVQNYDGTWRTWQNSLDDKLESMHVIEVKSAEPMSPQWLRSLMEGTCAEEWNNDGQWRVTGTWAAYYVRVVDGMLHVDVISNGTHPVARLPGDQSRGKALLRMLDIPIDDPGELFGITE